jgi:hypothetical protein
LGIEQGLLIASIATIFGASLASFSSFNMALSRSLPTFSLSPVKNTPLPVFEDATFLFLAPHTKTANVRELISTLVALHRGLGGTVFIHKLTVSHDHAIRQVG